MQSVDAPKSVVKSATHFFFGTVLSRISGFLREVALGAWFGATPLLASFFVAYRFSQLLRRLFGESSILPGFSPYFEKIRTHEPEKAAPFFRDLLVSITSLLGVVILILELVLFSWWKWGEASFETKHILFLTMVMLPGVLFICLYALFAALLQSDRKYFLPSAAPVFFNVVFLMVLWNAKELESEKGISFMAGGVTAAFFMQWAMLLWAVAPFLKQLKWRGAKLWPSELKKIVWAMGFTIVGIGATQINGFIDTLFARSADLAGPAYLYYAMRIYQLPLALVGIGFASASLPPLSRAVEAGHWDQFCSLIQFSMRKSLVFVIPMTVAILVLGPHMVNLVYGRGAFDAIATVETTKCLVGYSLGLGFAMMTLLLAPAFYAQKDFKTPLKASLISIATNLGLNALFIYGFNQGPATVAIATSIASGVNGIYLVFALFKKSGIVIERSTAHIAGKVLLGSLLSGCLTMAAGHLMGERGALELLQGTLPLFSRHFFTQIIHLVLYGGIYLLLFFSSAYFMKIGDVFQMIGMKRSNAETGS